MTVNKTLLITGMAMTLTVSGCASTGETKSESESKNYDVQGCIAGGLAAGFITYYKNFGEEDALKKTAIAGALGCMAGAVIGYQVEKRTQQYVDAQQAARTELARNQAETEKLKQYNAQVAQNIEDYKQQISDIQQVNYTEEEKMDKLLQLNDIVARQRTKAMDALSSVETDIAQAMEQFDTYQAGATPQDRDQWSAELASYQQEKQILTEYVGELNTLYATGATI
jgi:outer membrane lipoprotein SlyB